MNDSTARQQLILESEMEGFQEGYEIGKKEKLVRRFFTVFFSILIGLCLGYWWCYSVFSDCSSQAEKDLHGLENEMHKTYQKGYSFLAFNGQFRLFPVPIEKIKRFHYRAKNE